jgi:hypothetical protein
MDIRMQPLAAMGGGPMPAGLPAQGQAPPQLVPVVAILLVPMDQLQGLPAGQPATVMLPQGLEGQLLGMGGQDPGGGQVVQLGGVEQADPAGGPLLAAPGGQIGDAARFEAQPVGGADIQGADPAGMPMGGMQGFGGWPFGLGQVAAPEPLDPAKSAQQVLALVNAERAKAGLQALTLDERLNTAAQKHSEDMAKRGYMAHITPDGVDPWTRMGQQGAQGIGENIAGGQQTPEQAVQAWMDDPPHRAAILNPMARTMGLGVADGTMRLWTQDFGVN